MKINKKILASIIAVGILTTGTALANPFDDVPKDHWSYEAVQSLADQGIVEGFGDGTFRGDKLMTRYEMAQIVGRAISLNKGADNKTLKKLSLEYADELTALGVKVANLDKKTSGVQDLKISHWFQSENSYGNTMQKGKDDLHEYELEYRLTVEKEISPKTSLLHQLETKMYYDDATYANEGRDGTYTRLAYLTYKPDDKTIVTAGKNAYWLAGGLLGDDYIVGLDFKTKLDDKTSVELLHGRYWVDQYSHSRENMSENDKAQITYAGINTKLGKVDLGAHYMYGKQALNSVGSNYVDGFGNNMPGNLQNRSTNIWAVTAGVDIGNTGINLSGGYAENTKQDNDNALTKLQLFKKVGTTDVIAQYWNQEGMIDLPMENGNHMAWWGDMYTAGWGDSRGLHGVEGWRLVLGNPVAKNCYAEAWYGDYKDKITKEKSQKFGWALTYSY